MNFKVKFLNFYADVNQEQPEEATIPVHFRIENGKDAPQTSDGGSSDGHAGEEPLHRHATVGHPLPRGGGGRR